MRLATFAVGDIHGNREALDDLLRQLAGEVSAADTVVFLGDYVDRGRDVPGCIESILQFRRDVPAQVVTLLGNHEEWMLEALADPRRHSWWLAMDAMDTIESYSVDAARTLAIAADEAGAGLSKNETPLPYDVFFQAMPAEHLAFFRSLTLAHRTPEAICVHAGLDPDIPTLDAQPRDAILWGTPTFPEHYVGPDLVVYGHWDNATFDGGAWPRPTIGLASIGLDTISHGVLTAVRLPDRRIFQSARYE